MGELVWNQFKHSRRRWLFSSRPFYSKIGTLLRWLKQEVIHLHRLADAFDELKRRVASFLERFDEGSPALLRYTGLLPA